MQIPQDELESYGEIIILLNQHRPGHSLDFNAVTADDELFRQGRLAAVHTVDFDCHPGPGRCDHDHAAAGDDLVEGQQLTFFNHDVFLGGSIKTGLFNRNFMTAGGDILKDERRRPDLNAIQVNIGCFAGEKIQFADTAWTIEQLKQ